MITKEEANIIIKKLLNTYGYFDKKEEKEKIDVIKTYITELKHYNCSDILNAIDKLSTINKFIPTVAEIKITITEFSQNNNCNVNWNSAYWYENLKRHCDPNGIEYFDITKGVNYTLPPINGK